jgi:hypothetical protein
MDFLEEGQFSKNYLIIKQKPLSFDVKSRGYLIAFPSSSSSSHSLFENVV